MGVVPFVSVSLTSDSFTGKTGNTGSPGKAGNPGKAGTPVNTGYAISTNDTTSATSPLVGRLLGCVTLLRAAGLELAILTGHLFLYPTGVLPERLCSGPAPRPPVLLLHGFVDNRSVFALLRRSLRRNGWDQLYAFNYSPLTCDIRQAAVLLGHQVERLCAQTGRQRVDIVGHSLGGLIARYYVQRLGGDARVRTLVTLGTPHSGTRAVKGANTHPIVRQMRPHSELMAELAEPAVGCRTQFVAFWSDLDQIMVPVETARLEHPDLSVRNVAVHGIGHLTLPVNAAVAAGIREALTGGEQAVGVGHAA